MNTLTYKGYTASVGFDERDNLFVGRVLGVRDIIGFHGETVAELRADFEAAIDFMLQDCQARGIAPEKPASGKLMLRIPPEVHGAALVAAQAAGTSLNQWAAKVLAEVARG
jgi:predicted HicB family RNase H-like nuclease